MVESKSSGAGLAALLLAVAVIFGLKQGAEASPEDGGGEESPENGSSGGYPDYYMVSPLEVEEQAVTDDDYAVTFKTTIKNRGNAEGAFTLEWGTNELHAVTSAETFEVEGSQILRLQPGESYNWKYVKPDIPDYYRGYLKCWLFGEWDPNVPAIGVWT